MAQEQTCRECGTKLGPDVAEGICPACALRAALLPSANEIGREVPASLTGTTVHYFGDYELLAEIGRGGMGVVYRARQMSLNRPVALKMILAGRLASESGVKRFVQEAQAAANLQHPNIVAVHEVGHHDGQHYYTMDLVEGQNFGELVRQQPLPAQRAAQYVKIVADAVHYAHQHGTLHRDLKPTNILIDGRDQPRITDFGLARCEHTDASLTATGQLIGTPAFVSPEQAQGKTEAVSPHSDVYSIGAVLYYLLTQRPPFAAGSIPALLEMVLHREPVSPRALNPSVPRDLETICLKCLEKEPARRFRSAEKLSDELGRFCEGEPILSRPPNPVERAWRWCARNRAVAGSLAAVAIVLLAGTAISTWQAVRAKTEATKSRQIARFLQDMLKGVGPSVALGRDTTMLKEILDQTAERLGKELKGQPAIRADLQAIIGNVYSDLGLFDKAELLQREVLATVTKLRRGEHPDVANALSDLGAALQNEGKLADAEILDRQALAMRRRLYGNAHPDVAISLENLAQVSGLQGKLQEAEAMFREVVAMQKKLLGNVHADVATSVQNLAQTLRVEGKLSQAETLERDALAMREKLFGHEHPDVAVSLNGLGIVLDEEGRWNEAESMYREALSLRRKFLGNDHPEVAQTLNNLANLLRDQGNYAEAEATHREALAIERKRRGDSHPEVANSLNNLALVLRNERKLSEAETMAREALALWKKLNGDEHFLVATGLNNLGVTLREEGKLAEAESALRDALAIRRKVLGNEHPNTATSLEELAEVLRDTGRLDEAERLLRECLSIREKALPDAWPVHSARTALGETLLLRKQYVEAEQLLVSGCNGSLERQSRIPVAARQRLKKAVESLVTLYQETARSEKAAEWKQRLGELNKPKAEAQPKPEPGSK